MDRPDVKTIDEYIALFPDDVKEILEKVRQTIQQAAPEATERISYRIPTFDQNGYLIYFAAFRDHIGIYPITAAMEKELGGEIEPYRKGKGTLQFPLNQSFPYDLLKKIVQVRVEENLRK